MATVERYLAASRREDSGKEIDKASAGDFPSKLHKLRAGICRGVLPALAVALLSGAGPALAETVAGVTAGSLSVDSSGSANYTIPIDVPPGVAGMAPGLSLNYKSHGGNGLLGVGWSLGGLSVIHRCAQTIAQDGVNGGVNLDAEDRFCLDGQRLILISGTYGGNGAEYRTEIDSFARITSYGAAGTGPESFTVETKSGRIHSYGNTADSRLEADGSATVRLWALDEAADRSGNYMTYHYADDTTAKTFKIDRIEYAGNSNELTAPQSEVKFVYETRPDTRSSYQVGSLLNTTDRLLRVETWTDGGLVRRYELAYHDDTVTHLSRVASVTECDAGTQCLAPITFDWEVEPAGFFEDSAYALPVTAFDEKGDSFVDLNGDGLVDFLRAINGTRTAWLNTGSGWQQDAAYQPPADLWRSNFKRGSIIDIDGDGLPDFLEAYSTAASARTAWLNTGAGWEVSTAYKPPFRTIYDAVLVYYEQVCNDNGSCRWSRRESTFKRALGDFVDLNGDGLVDFAHAYSIDGSSVRNAWLNNGAGWTETPALAPPADTIQHEAHYDTYTTGGGVASTTRNIAAYNGTIEIGQFVDVDGDGRADLLQAYGSFHNVWLNKPGGWMLSASYEPPFDLGYGTQDSHTTCHNDEGVLGNCSTWTSPYTYSLRLGGARFLDLNGDGLIDRLQATRIGSTSVQTAWINTGTGWTVDAGYQPPDYLEHSEQRRAELTDVNKDGLPDFVLAYRKASNPTDHYQTWLNTGQGWAASAGHLLPDFLSYHWTNNGQPRSQKWRGLLQDLDGDGLVDYVHGQGGSRTAHFATYGAVKQVTGVTDSLGRSTTIVHTPLTDGFIYSKGTGTVFPEIDLQSPLYVVEELSTDDGVGGQARTTYKYEGARLHAQGRSFLGFGRMTAVDQQTGIETVTDYRRDFPFIGTVEASETRLADGTKIQNLVNTWSETQLNGGLTFFPHVSSTISSGFEINDGPGNSAVTTSTTVTTYDDFGNPTLVTATTTGGGESFETVTDNDFTNDTVDWLIGQFDRAAVTNTLPDLTSDTRVTAFDYEAVTGLLSQETIEPDLPAFTLTTGYGYDGFGNLTSTTVSGTGITSRTTTTSFPTDGRFAESASNALGHPETRAFDARFGTVTSLTGPNLITTSWTYDGFGRQTKEVRADGSETRWSYDLCVAQCPAGGVYAVSQQDFNTASDTAIGPRQLQYFDALNRVFRSETEGFDGTKVYADTSFNARGEVVAVTRPYFDGTAAPDIQSATSTYDVLSRTLTVTQPDAGVESTAYAGLTVTLTNALNQTQTRKSNAIGQLVEVTDNLNTVVTYAYDPFGNLVETNAGGVATTMGYDIRGLKTSMNDPDMGIWSYDHNVLGELTTQTDSNNQSVNLEYDLLGRMTKRTEPEGITEWFYDTAAKGKGKLHTISAPHDGYALSQSYDSLGRPSATTTTVDGVDYTETVTYDTSGRPEVLTYPSGFAVKNAYNSRGFLTSVSEDGGTTTYWQADAVNAEGQATQATFGNGLVTTNAYDPQTARIDSILTTQGATPIQDLTYDFDKLGNLKKRSDLQQDREESFLYDGLNRMTTTTLTDTGTGGGTLAASSYNYNAIGNLTFKTGLGTMVYGGVGAGPHAVTEADGKTYSYDANGNMTASSDTGGSPTGGDLTVTGFSVPDAQDRILLVAVSAEERSVIGATFGGLAMTEAGRVSNGANTVVLYELRDASIGAGVQTGDLVVDLGGTSGSAQVTAWTITDVDQSAAPVISQASNVGAAETTISGTITTTAENSIVVSAFGLGDPAVWSSGPGEAQIGYRVSTGQAAGGASYEVAGAGIHGLSWSGTAAARPTLLLAAYPATVTGSSGFAINNPQSGSGSLPGYTVGAGTDRVLLVGVATNTTGTSNLDVSFGGTPMIRIQTLNNNSLRTALFHLPESALGAGSVTGDITVDVDGSTPAVAEISAFYLTGVDQNELAKRQFSNTAVFGDTSSMSGFVSTNAPDTVVVSAFSVNVADTWSPGGDETSIVYSVNGGNAIAASYEVAPTSGTSVNMSWSGPAAARPTIIMATYGLLAPAGSGGGGGGPSNPTVVGAATGSVGGDATGSGGNRTVTWSSFNKPTLIKDTDTGNEAAFTYGPDRARFKQHVVDNSLAHNVVYVGSLYEHRTRLGNPDELVHYILAGATVAIHTIHDDNLAATNKTRYLHRDHLGSVDTLTGETGAVIERLSYDPHGKRRLADWSVGDPVSPSAETPRGFTGHEHLDSVGLIHMNGRVYDPTLGRFLSPDPFVFEPDTTKGFNRYSYVFNNPLSYTDPSGFMTDRCCGENTDFDEHYASFQGPGPYNSWAESQRGQQALSGPPTSIQVSLKQARFEVGLVGQFWIDADVTLSGLMGLDPTNPYTYEQRAHKAMDENNDVLADKEIADAKAKGLPKGRHARLAHENRVISNAARLGRVVHQLVNLTADDVATRLVARRLAVTAVLPIAGALVVADGFLPVGDILAGVLLGGAVIYDSVVGAQADAAAEAISERKAPQVLYHYTTEEGMLGIVGSGYLWASTIANNPKDARYGDGQYFSDVLPGSMTSRQLSSLFFNMPFAEHRFTHFVAVDVSGLNVVMGRPHVFVVPNTKALPVADRIKGFGPNQ